MRLAVVLFNLGGPDQPDSVQPFLLNLFSDPAIIGLPNPLRWLLAQMISRRRAPMARDNYAKLGGGSPILANTQAQAHELKRRLQAHGEVDVFVCMRHWHPMATAVARRVREFAPDRVAMVPLYPQFSTTTTGSALADWRRACRTVDLDVPTVALGCFPTDPGLIAAMVAPIRDALADAAGAGKPRLLLSAHGLPKKIVAAGDPYQWQVEETAAAIIQGIGMSGLDWVTSYQSRVGPLEWIGPSTEAEIQRAGADGVPVVVAPIAFVSEHIETLVEIEIEYRHLAGACGVPKFVRVPTVGAAEAFIDGLARQVEALLIDGDVVRCGAGRRLCPTRFNRCVCA